MTKVPRSKIASPIATRKIAPTHTSTNPCPVATLVDFALNFVLELELFDFILIRKNVRDVLYDRGAGDRECLWCIKSWYCIWEWYRQQRVADDGGDDRYVFQFGSALSEIDICRHIYIAQTSCGVVPDTVVPVIDQGSEHSVGICHESVAHLERRRGGIVQGQDILKASLSGEDEIQILAVCIAQQNTDDIQHREKYHNKQNIERRREFG
jgi:hypothetical protein